MTIKTLNRIAWWIPVRYYRDKFRSKFSTIFSPEYKLLKKICNGKFKILHSNFEGMNYTPNSSGSAFCPKILGSYEEPIHKWIEELENKNYDVIIDVGCAEGFYAVGFAYRGFAKKVIGYDINKKAIKLAKKLASKNKLKSELILNNSFCGYKEIEDIVNNSKKVLIFCDIEGGEIELLDNKKCKSLNKVDIILESHDIFYKEEKYITNIILERFKNTHKIEIVEDYKRDENKYPTLIKITDNDIKNSILNEYRAGIMSWIRLISID